MINHFITEHSFLIRFIKLLLVFKHQDLQMSTLTNMSSFHPL